MRKFVSLLIIAALLLPLLSFVVVSEANAWWPIVTAVGGFIARHITYQAAVNTLRSFAGAAASGVIGTAAWECASSGCRLENQWQGIASLPSSVCRAYNQSWKDVRVIERKVAVVGTRPIQLSSTTRIGCVHSNSPFKILRVI